MRSRFGVKSGRKTAEWPLWLFVGLLVLWGGYQALKLRRRVLADLAAGHGSHRATAASHPSRMPAGNPFMMSPSAIGPAAPAATPPAIAEPPAALLRAVDATLAKARLDIRRGRWIRARRRLNAVLVRVAGMNLPQAKRTRRMLTRINHHTLLGSALLPDDPLARLIRVRPGWNVDYVANLYRITPWIFLRLNPGLDPARLRAGAAVKIVRGPFNAHLVLHASRIDLYDRHCYVESFPVRWNALAPPAPGIYHVKKRDFSGISGAGLPLGRLILQPRSGHTGRKIIIAGVAAGPMDIFISSRGLRTLLRTLGEKYSLVVIKP